MMGRIGAVNNICYVLILALDFFVRNFFYISKLDVMS
jgi:hypothetical protein